jgi:TonB family protein
MQPFFVKLLVALAFLTVTQTVPPEPSLAHLQSSDSTGNTPGAAMGPIELLTPTEGLDFNPFMRSSYLSIKREWFAGMPPSVEKGEKGIVVIQFEVQQDGKLPDDSLRVKASSGKKELDNASLNAIRNAAPFDHLPSKFSQPLVDLRMTFYYNVAPPKKP